jgi:hypothetical protein
MSPASRRRPVWTPRPSGCNSVGAPTSSTRTGERTSISSGRSPNSRRSRRCRRRSMRGGRHEPPGYGTLARAVFSDVAVSQIASARRAIGSGTGRTSSDGVIFNVSGRGADIWGTTDAFYYCAGARVGQLFADGASTQRYQHACVGESWRDDSREAGREREARVHAGLCRKGVSFQYRTETGGQTFQVTGHRRGASVAADRAKRRSNRRVVAGGRLHVE